MKDDDNLGLVIGLSASQIISNVLLIKWDMLIIEKLTPIYYGRYVDDMLLVFHNPYYDSRSKVITNTKSLMKFLQSKLCECNTESNKQNNHILAEAKNDAENNNDIWEINLGKNYQGKSKIQLQDGKQKLFILDGQAGLDLIDAIEKEIHDLSSEHRLMPEPDKLESNTAAKVLCAESKVGEEAVTLRHSDTTTIKRLGWSLQLRHVETLANNIPANLWKKERKEFYEFAHNHILRAEKVFEHYKYLPRLLGIAIRLKDWQEAEKIIKKSIQSLKDLSDWQKESTGEIYINGKKYSNESFKPFDEITKSLTVYFFDSIKRSYFLDNKSSKEIENLMKVLNQENEKIEKFSLEEVFLIAKSDLAYEPYKNLIKNKKIAEILFNGIFALDDKTLQNQNKILENLKNYIKVNHIRTFVKKLKVNNDETYCFLMPFLFPSRPYKPHEIAELRPECVRNVSISMPLS